MEKNVVFMSRLYFYFKYSKWAPSKVGLSLFGIFGRNPEEAPLDFNLDSKTKQINGIADIFVFEAK